MRLGFFGAGNMVSAIAQGISKEFPEYELNFYSPSGISSKKLAEVTNGHFISEISKMPLDLDGYFLGFKPQNLSEFEFEFRNNSLVISLLAGTTVEVLKKKNLNARFVRVMPNTPSSVFAGMNLLYFESVIDKNEQENISELFQNIGEVCILKNEIDIDLLTPFTGSGPGIIFELALYLENTLKKLNIKEIDTRKLIAQTFYGSSKLMISSEKSFEELRDQVTSKKGVTFEALETMRKNNMSTIFDDSIKSAHCRIEEMKKGI